MSPFPKKHPGTATMILASVLAGGHWLSGRSCAAELLRQLSGYRDTLVALSTELCFQLSHTCPEIEFQTRPFLFPRSRTGEDGVGRQDARQGPLSGGAYVKERSAGSGFDSSTFPQAVLENSGGPQTVLVPLPLCLLSSPPLAQ